MPLLPKQEGNRTPAAAVAAVVAASATPFVLGQVGLYPGLVAAGARDGALGSHVHILLEWSGVCVAAVTVLLAFLHYRERGEATTPIIGLTWFGAGLIDVFHTLGSAGLIPVVADGQAFTEFTWVISRTVNAVLLIVGAALFLISGRTLSPKGRERGMGFILGVTAALGFATAALILACATRAHLPDALRSWSLLTRVWDALPLFLFVLCGALVLPTFYRWHPSVFTHALLVSMIPQVAAQLHMALGSSAVYDGHYQAAHLLKIVAYAVPLVGLLMDYRQTHAMSVQAEEERAGELFVRRQAEEVLSRDRSILKILMENSAEMVGIKDASLRYTRVNRAQGELMGIARPLDAAGRSDADFFPEAFAGESQRLEKQVLRTASPVLDQAQEISRAGRKVRVYVSRFPLTNEEGAVVGVVTITRGDAASRPG